MRARDLVAVFLVGLLALGLWMSMPRGHDPETSRRSQCLNNERQIGLAMVQHIVEAHRGIVDVESRLVKGSTFRIFLPARDNLSLREDENDAQNPGS